MPTELKISTVKKVLKGECSVTSAARELGIARKTVYSWLKIYKNAAKRNKKSCLIAKYTKGYAHPKEYKHTLEQKMIRLIKKNPTLSVTKMAEKLKAGHHAVYNLLKALKLNTENSRLAYSKIYAFPGIFDPEIKKSAVRKVLNSEGNVSDISKELKVSRKTIYKWLKDYKESGDVKNNYLSGFDHPRSLGQEAIGVVLAQVAKTPELSIHRLAGKLGYSSHAVFDILQSNFLTHKNARITYSQMQATEASDEPQTVGVIDRVRSVFETFTPNLAPAPPPKFISILKPFLVSSCFTFIIVFGVLLWIDVISGSGSFTAGVGLTFALIALATGTFFFLYSFKYYLSTAILLSFSNKQKKGEVDLGNPGMNTDLSGVKIKKYPYVSVQIPFYNEKNVVERSIKAATDFDYPEYEVILCDDSTDETTDKIRAYQKSCLFKGESLKEVKGDGFILTEVEVKPGVTLKHLHRTTRSGYKGGALDLALKLVNPRTEFVSIFDADFVPYPDSLNFFVKYFKVANGLSEDYSQSNVAAVQGYQWHVLNKSENWITRGVRSEYAGSYVVERSGAEIYKGLKQISGSVYMIRKDVLNQVGWGTSITEDFELTLKIYNAGYKVVYTPYVQAPAECVSTLRRIVRQRMRWAEGHSFNVKLMAWKLLKNPKLTLAEKAEFVYLMPYYLQALFFLTGTFCWFLSEAVFRVRLPFWTELWGWSLILTNMISLPLLNATGMFLEESKGKDYVGLTSFVALSYLLVPFQAYAAVKGFLEEKEGPWFRTPKTGHITDVFKRSEFYRFIQGIMPGNAGVRQDSAAEYLAISTANSQFNKFNIPFSKGLKWKGRGFLAILLIISNLVLSLAPGVPYFVKPEVTQARSFDTIKKSAAVSKDKTSIAPVDNFENGVLVFNTDKSSYLSGETALLQMGVLDKNGDTLCNADIGLNVYSPDGEINKYNVTEQSITKSATCQSDNNVTDNPDYFVNYGIKVAGVYKYDLINNSNGYKITGSFEAGNSSAATIERIGATRINPFKSDYKMGIKLTANQDISGNVSEGIPDGFIIKNGSTSLSINLKKGQTKTFEYTYQAPKVSPEVYTLGPLTLNNSALEKNSWRLASDATITSNASGNWSATAWPNTTARTGTITTSTSSTAVTGVNTLFTTEISVGNIIETTSNVAICTVASITDNTNLTCTGNAASTNSGISYRFQGIGPGDTASIASAANLTVDGNYTVAAMTYAGTGATIVTISSTYTLTVSGTLTMPRPATSTSMTLAVGAGTLHLGALTMTATLTGRNDIITVSTGSVIIDGTFTSGTSGTACTTGCQFNFSDAGLLQFNGGFAYGPAALSPSTGTVEYTTNTPAIQGFSGSYYDLRFTGNGTTSGSAAGTITVTHDLTATGGGVFNFTARPVTISGAVAQSIAGYTTTGLTTVSNNAATVTFQGNINGGALTKSGASGTLDLGSGLTHVFTGNWVRTAGTIDGTNCTSLTIGGSVTNTAGTFIPCENSIFNRVGNQTLPQVTYRNLEIGGSTSKVMTGVTTVNGNFSVTGTAAATPVLTSITGNMTIDNGTSTLTVGGVALDIGGNITVLSGILTTGTYGLTVHGTTNVSGGTMNINGGTNNKTFMGLVTADGGILQGNSTVAVMQGGLTQSSGTCALTSTARITFEGDQDIHGTCTIPNITAGSGHTVTNYGNVTVNTAITLTGNWVQADGSALTLTGATPFSGSGTFSASAPINTVTYNGAAQTVKDPNGGTAHTYHSLSLAGSAAKTMTGITNINGDLTTAGTCTMTTAADLSIGGGVTIGDGTTLTVGATYTLNVAGDWSNSGIFTANSRGVVLNGAGGSTQTVSGSTIFYDLTATAVAARTIAFTDGTTQTITHALTLTGSTSQLITLQRTGSSSQWNIDTTGATVDLDYLSVSYSSSATCIVVTNSTNGGNNHDWDFTGNGCVNSTQYSFQRKTWHDGARYWKSFATGLQIQFWYSSDGSSWIQNTSATITVESSDFSVEADSGNAFVVYKSGNDIIGRAATSYPGTGFVWGAETTVSTGSNASGMVGWWKLDENTGITFADSSGNNFSGSITGTVPWVAGQYGYSLDFPGVNANYASIPDTTGSPLDTTNAITVEAWINSANNTNTYARIVDKTYNTAWSFASRATNNNNLSVWMNNAEVAYTADNVYSLGTWTHVAFTYDKNAGGTQQIRIYVDGTQVATGNYTTAIGTNDAAVGIGGSSTGQYTFDGNIDDVRIYNYARTPTQIADDIANSNQTSDEYSYPTIERDSGSYVWVASRFTNGSVFYMKTIKQTVSTNTLPQDSGDSPNAVYPISDVANTNANVFGTIVPRGSNDMYATVVNNTSLRGCVWVNGSTAWQNTAAASCASGANYDPIGTVASGVSRNISAVSDSSGNVHLLYIDPSGYTTYQEYTGSWQSAVTLDSNSGNTYPSITLDTSDSSLYAFWVRHNGSDDHIYYKNSANWGAVATDWHSGTNLTNLTTNYSGDGTTGVFGEWTSDASEPYTVNWETIVVPENLRLLFSLGILMPLFARKKTRKNSVIITRKP